MSRNSKMVNKARVAKQLKGQVGPKKTTPKHGKKKAWYQLKDAAGRLLCMVNRNSKNKAASTAEETTV